MTRICIALPEAVRWVALRLDTGTIDWEEVADLVMYSYLLVAPKRLAALVTTA
jgi:predicted DNA-binding protein (MmcQ/YjbR family)